MISDLSQPFSRFDLIQFHYNRSNLASSPLIYLNLSTWILVGLTVAWLYKDINAEGRRSQSPAPPTRPAPIISSTTLHTFCREERASVCTNPVPVPLPIPTTYLLCNFQSWKYEILLNTWNTFFQIITRLKLQFSVP